MRSICSFWFFGAFCSCAAQDIHSLVLDTGRHASISRAELHYLDPEKAASGKAILVLCPGANGNGLDLLSEKMWQDFASSNRLGLVALSFASETSLLKAHEGYYYPRSSGSGELLVEGLRSIYDRDLPIILYGFSGGAHFTMRFTEEYPARVEVWCAYAFGWWDEPSADEKSFPPGVLACGAEDYQRHTQVFQFFLAGRSRDRHLTWISLGDQGHSRSKELEQFARVYFESVLHGNPLVGEWYDSQTKALLRDGLSPTNFNLATWLPSVAAADLWLELHAP